MMTFKIVMPLNHTAGDEAECRKIGGKLYTIICNTEEELITATRDADAIRLCGESRCVGSPGWSRRCHPLGCRLPCKYLRWLPIGWS